MHADMMKSMIGKFVHETVMDMEIPDLKMEKEWGWFEMRGELHILATQLGPRLRPRGFGRPCHRVPSRRREIYMRCI